MSDGGEELFCFLCEKPENDRTRVIECASCCRSAHFRCKKIYGNAITKVKKKPFFCSSDCAEMYAKLNHQQTHNDDIIGELKQLGQCLNEVKQESVHVRAAVESTKSQMITIMETTKQIEKSQDFLSGKFEDLRAEFGHFKSELSSLKAECNGSKQEILDWQKKHRELSQTVVRMEMELDKVNRSTLARNAVLLGVPLVENENTLNLVHKIGEVINCSLDFNAIVGARRLTVKNSVRKDGPILVTFYTEAAKEQFFERKRQYGVLLVSAVLDNCSGMTNRITIRDEMTAFGRDLLREVKKLQEPYDIKYVWLGRNGAVLIKRSDGAKIHRVESKQQLESIMQTIFKRSLDQSGNSSMMSSPSGEPSAKR